jgi:ankyrin repeat protein
VIALFGWFARSAVAQADSRLADAAMKRDRNAVRALLAQKADANASSADGSSALLWLVRVDDLEMARLLIQAGADATRPNRYGVTPLYLACSNGNAEMIRLLLDAGVDPNAPDPTGETPLMTAARIGDPAAVGVLLDYGAIVDAKDPEFQQTALMIAVRENHTPVVQMLVEAWHADINARTRIGRTPPWVLPNSVPGFGHGIGIVRGGLPERGSRYLTLGGLTPLLYAARDGRLESARILVKAGATLEQVEANGITPLLMAIANNHIDVARFLIEQGAQINVSDWYGRTPLWAAVEARNMDVDNARSKMAWTVSRYSS